MKLKTFLLICFSFVETVLVAKESNVHYIVQHYDEYNGLAQRWATQIVQGDDGYIWISTWNGLDRFDGYEFVNFKSTNREGHGLPSDRISDMWKLKSGDLLCHVDYCLFVFDTHRYKFVNVLERLERKRHTYIQYPMSIHKKMVPFGRFAKMDNESQWKSEILWAL